MLNNEFLINLIRINLFNLLNNAKLTIKFYN